MACTKAFGIKWQDAGEFALAPSAAKGECKEDVYQMAATGELCMHSRITAQSLLS